jgi:hypothetical protein
LAARARRQGDSLPGQLHSQPVDLLIDHSPARIVGRRESLSDFAHALALAPPSQPHPIPLGRKALVIVVDAGKVSQFRHPVACFCSSSAGSADGQSLKKSLAFADAFHTTARKWLFGLLRFSIAAKPMAASRVSWTERGEVRKSFGWFSSITANG